MVLNRTITSAMATQVDRVNRQRDDDAARATVAATITVWAGENQPIDDPETLVDEVLHHLGPMELNVAVEPVHGGVTTVQQQQASHRQEKERLEHWLEQARERIRQLEEQLAAVQDAPRKEVTPKRAAEMLGVSQSTISRYLNEGWLTGYQVSRGKKPRWMVVVDESFRRKPRRTF